MLNFGGATLKFFVSPLLNSFLQFRIKTSSFSVSSPWPDPLPRACVTRNQGRRDSNSPTLESFTAMAAPRSLAQCEQLACPSLYKIQNCPQDQNEPKICQRIEQCINTCSNLENVAQEVKCRDENCKLDQHAFLTMHMLKCAKHHSCTAAVENVQRKQKLQPRPMPATQAKVAVLYSGRFFAAHLTPTWFESHLTNLIRPNRAAVFLSVDFSNWCSVPSAAAEELKAANKQEQRTSKGVTWEKRWEQQTQNALRLLRDQASTAFQGYEKLYVRVYPSSLERVSKSDVINAARGRCNANHVHKFIASQVLMSWKRQFDHFSGAEGLRKSLGDDHDVIIRARLDVVFLEPFIVTDAVMHAVQSSHHVFTVERRNDEAQGGWAQWRDWIYVGSSGAMRVLAESWRKNLTSIAKPWPGGGGCYGFGPEAAIQINMEADGFRLVRFPSEVMLVRFDPNLMSNKSITGFGACTARSLKKPPPNDKDADLRKTRMSFNS